ncbi:MAG: hypothetical protein HRT44_10415, partial [Bdellovibrionales bacterium]|nr:hypothetical protein [Bdellovibrionales bacterium]
MDEESRQVNLIKLPAGDYQLQAVDIDMAQGRSSIMLQQNEYIDLTWRMTSKA